MLNELLLIGSVILIYGAVLIAYRIFGRSGLYAMTAFVAVFANIEVLIIINAFGMEQTLGNVMFASTYLITDILSENEGKKYASRAVFLGTFISVVMLCFSQYLQFYTPAPADWASGHIFAIFEGTPRVIFGSLAGYVASQLLDVHLYHFFWRITAEKTGSKKRFLWLRNNGATLISQLLNTVLFTLIAFAGWYSTKTLISIMLSSYAIYICTSLLDTPAVYIARRIAEKRTPSEL